MTPLINFIDNTLARAAFSRGGSNSSNNLSSSSMSDRASRNSEDRGSGGGGEGGLVGPGGISANTAKEARKVFGNILQIRELTKHFLEELEPVATDPKFKVRLIIIIAYYCLFYLIPVPI
jgi:hypothetical protein